MIRSDHSKIFIAVLSLIFVAGTFAPALAFAKTSNDPKGKQHWSFKDIGAYDAWDITTGSKEVVVAVIDNGFDANHPDLKDNVWKNIDEIANNNIDDDKNGYIDDVLGWNFVGKDNDPIPDVSRLSNSQKEDGFFNHGTLVAGIIGAVGNNKKDMAGLNWNVRLMNLKVLSNTGEGSEAALTEAMLYAVNNGAHIINISAVGGDSKGLRTAISVAYEKGVVVIAAAGNNAESLKTSPLYPACSDAGSKVQKVLGVSAIEESHLLASFSNYGSECVDITAPGVDIGSLLRYEPGENLKVTYSNGWDGTSFSAPLVTGAAALVKSLQPEWKAPQIYDALLKTTHKTPPDDEEAYKNMYGAGLLQVDKAVEYAQKKRANFTNLQGIGLFDQTSGSFVHIAPSTMPTASTRGVLLNLTDFDAYTVNGKTQYVTLRPFEGENRITIYSADWKKLDRVALPLGVEGKMFVDQFGTGEPQILFAPVSESQPFVIFSLEGKKVKELSLDVSGTITGVNLLSSVGSNKKEIGVLSKDERKYILTIFDENLVKQSSVTFSGVGTIVNVQRGDMDANGTSEYIVLSQKGLNAALNIIDLKGKLIKQFVLSNTVKAMDFQFSVGDFTGDKKDDIITLEKNAERVVIWKNTGEIVKSISFPRVLNQYFSFIPLY